MKKLTILLALFLSTVYVFCQNEWVHMTTKKSLKNNSSLVEFFAVDNNPESIIFVKPEQKNEYQVGVRFNGKKWEIYRLDYKPLDENLTFKMISYDQKSEHVFIHETDTTNTIEFCTLLRYDALNGNPDAKIDITFNQTPNGKNGKKIEDYFNLEYNTLFEKWIICYPEDKVFPMGVSFNVRIY